MNGIIIINKPKDYTSRDIVNIACKKLNTKKVGHTGTLDPMATGVLVLCVGSATKLVDVITSYDKEYIVEVELGTLTDTLDITGNIIKDIDFAIEKEEIEKCLKSFIGFYNQEVPIYSAVKINGKKLYEYARNNEEVTLPSREVEIKELELLDDPIYKDSKTILKLRCLVSKGTYIRSLIRDIALKLNTVGTMTSLCRTKQGEFDLSETISLEDLENNNYKIYEIDNILNNFYTVVADDYLENKIKNGCILQNRYEEEIILFKNKENKVMALYKVYEKDKAKIKPWKMFLS